MICPNGCDLISDGYYCTQVWKNRTIPRLRCLRCGRRCSEEGMRDRDMLRC